jgi:hypothetical protein
MINGLVPIAINGYHHHRHHLPFQIDANANAAVHIAVSQPFLGQNGGKLGFCGCGLPLPAAAEKLQDSCVRAFSALGTPFALYFGPLGDPVTLS